MRQQLRRWQQKAITQYEDGGRPRDFLVVATPASGKTTLAGELGKQLLYDGEVIRVVVIVPTTHLCTQWQKRLSEIGIELQVYDNDDTPEAPDQAGMICTYHQLNERWVHTHRGFCKRPTLAIFDELHHAGRERAWGDNLWTAFEHASKRLALSGTPWRNDNNPIPFVHYDTNGISHADFTYSYGDALRDGICRQVYFPIYDGTMEWWSARTGIRSVDWRTELNRLDASRRLVTALTVGSSNRYFETMLKNAHTRLLEVRELHTTAGGLVIAKDQDHARQIAKLLADLSGEQPALAISDLKDSTEVIETFTTSAQMWIVAVKMISEGVDIPRLRVGVYATNVADSEMFFRQAVGRFVRVQSEVEDEQSAFVYLPADDRLIAFAEAIKNERDHQLEEIEPTPPKLPPEPGGNPDFFVPGSATEGARIGVINDGETLGDHDLQPIEAECREYAIPLRYAPQLLRWSRSRGGGSSVVDEPETVRPAESLQQRKKKLGGLVERLARQLSIKSGTLLFSEVNVLLCIATDARKKDRTLEQLQYCERLLRSWLCEVADGVVRSFEEWRDIARRARQ